MEIMEEETSNGDDVIIKYTQSKQIIGKVQSIQEKKVYFVKYFYPEETKVGRQAYHSKYELFKSDVHDLTTIDKIEKKVEILKNMEEFISKDYDEIQNGKIFIIRQFYDQHNCQCMPETIKEHTCYFCQTIVNPDEKIIKCAGCEYFFHIKCLIELTIKQCPNQNCEYPFELEKLQELNLKRKVDSESEIEFIPLKKQQSKFTLKNQQKYSVTSSFQSGQIALNKHINGKKNNSRPYQNINDNNYEKLKKAIEKYRIQAKNSKLCKGISKDRDAAKENLFSNLMYGLFELTEREQDTENLSNEEQIIATKSGNEQFELAKSLAVSIETCIFIQQNNGKQNMITNNYRQKFRELLANLKDDKNFELRFLILTKKLSPEQLSKMNGRELANSEKKREWKKREDLVLKSKTLMEQPEFIAKTHKGQEILQLDRSPIPIEEKMIEEEIEEEKISDCFTDSDPAQNGNSQQQANSKSKQKLRETQELQKQLSILINGKQKDKIIQRMQKHLPIEISENLIQKFTCC